MSDGIGLVIIAIGVLFDLLGCIGMVRFPDVYNRLQAGTKCVTLGVCLILIGTVVKDLTEETRRQVEASGVESIDDVRNAGKRLVSMSPAR